MNDYFVIVDGEVIGFDSLEKANDFFIEVELDCDTTVYMCKVIGSRFGDCV